VRINLKVVASALYRVSVGDRALYFSYETCVAFSIGSVLYVSENVWSVEAGKHLNSIDGGKKESRLPHAEFMELLHSHFGG
jgi:hypothetical protein